MYVFENKVVWVTGSSTGIGRAAAKAFAEHGADVVLHCNESRSEAESLERELEALGRKTLLVQGDVADGHAVEAMAARVRDAFGGVDILMNNAGSLIKRARIEDMEESVWDRVLDVNLKSVFLVTRAVLPMMRARGGGRIINLSSIAARNGGGPGSGAYGAAKAGVANLTRTMAKEFVGDNILVNAIAPGVITTPFHDRFTPDDVRRRLAEQIPMGREGTPEETVGAALFLASGYAGYITGEVIEVNGGQLMN
ncbi:MAG TPA: 3-oxoacyl-ACP reductase family protein [Gammaproteobacteria bacterium]|nr:3-oxoacyl-ACP reductase family protein [Gammaproteobacteria bacterium]